MTSTSLHMDKDAERLYYELCYRKAARRIAWSTQNIVAWSPPSYNNLDTRFSRFSPSIGAFSPCRTTSLDANGPAWSFTNNDNLFPFDRVESHHRFGDDITDLVWNQTGSALASIDQRGKIAIWTMNNYVNRWKCICNVNLGENVIEFMWLDSARLYSRVSKARSAESPYKRGSFKGPRNQFGEFAFITVTTDGKVAVWYQKGKKFFSKIISHLRYPSKRISHADIVLSDGNYILATYSPEFLPKLVMFYEIKIDMLSLQVGCQPIANIHLATPIRSNVFNSSIAMWEINKSTPPIESPETAMKIDIPPPNVQFIVCEQLDHKLVTNIWIQENELFLGFSDGQVQFRHYDTLKILPEERHVSIKYFQDYNFPKYSTWVPSNYTACTDAIIEFATSPNGTLLLCRRASDKLDCLDIADALDQNIDLLARICVASSCANKLTLSILNNIDHTDLENIIKKFSGDQDDQDDQEGVFKLILKETFTNLSSVFPDGLETTASSDFLSRLFGIQLSLLKSCRRDNITYLNTLYFMHLRALEKIFQNNVSSDGTFSLDSLQSLLSLTSWVMDFSVYFIKDTYLLFFTMKPGRDLSSEKSHIILLYNLISRTAFKNLLSLVGKFKEHVNSLAANSPLDFQDMNRTLQYSFESWPLKLESLESFINEAGSIIDKSMKEISDPQLTKYEIFFDSKLQKSLHGTLRELEQIFINNITTDDNVNLYVYDTKWISSESVDIILKSRTIKDRVCTRCGHYSTKPDMQSTRWARSYTRSCVCGGLWIYIKEK
ncbi:12047_t:CDS:10 [Funneliformis geosporum]|nr:12047_t:CDS:10 [Funneliformis geosporum]